MRLLNLVEYHIWNIGSTYRSKIKPSSYRWYHRWPYLFDICDVDRYPSVEAKEELKYIQKKLKNAGITVEFFCLVYSSLRFYQLPVEHSPDGAYRALSMLYQLAQDQSVSLSVREDCLDAAVIVEGVIQEEMGKDWRQLMNEIEEEQASLEAAA